MSLENNYFQLLLWIDEQIDGMTPNIVGIRVKKEVKII